MPSVQFLHVADNTIKTSSISSVVGNHFLQKQPILIIVPNADAASYVDQLLWRLPEDSFVPHQIASEPISENVVITTEHRNLNGAKFLFNLCSTIIPIFSQFELIYELLDQTHPE